MPQNYQLKGTWLISIICFTVVVCGWPERSRNSMLFCPLSAMKEIPALLLIDLFSKATLLIAVNKVSWFGFFCLALFF